MHPLTKMFHDEPVKMILIVIWKLRRYLPGLQVEVTEEDLKSLTLAIEAFGAAPGIAIIGSEHGLKFQVMDTQTRRRMEADPTINENSPEAQRMARSMNARASATDLIARVKKRIPESGGEFVAVTNKDFIELIETLEALV